MQTTALAIVIDSNPSTLTGFVFAVDSLQYGEYGSVEIKKMLGSCVRVDAGSLSGWLTLVTGPRKMRVSTPGIRGRSGLLEGCEARIPQPNEEVWALRERFSMDMVLCSSI